MVKLFKNWKNNKTLLFLGFLLLTLFLFWPLPASAFLGTIVNYLLTLPYILISLFLILVINVSWAFAWLTGTLLDWVISPDFISLGYTNPAKNQVIALGLNITQSFVNLLLVVALVYTALAIALRINETEAKKTLVRLIIVALLVNFAPVFCGLVVDAANIVMNYFLKPIQEGVSGVLTQIGTFVDTVKHLLWQVTGDLPRRLGVIMMVATQVTVNLAMGTAFFLFAGIFLVRYIIIWVLVILAPIAFVCWVLPQTKSLWNMWLNNFVQWSIIGIPIAFFLYLAMSSFTILSREFKGKIEMPGIEATAVGFFNEAFPFLVVIVFLILGFTIGLATSAMGGSAVINLMQRGIYTRTKEGKFEPGWALRAGKRATKSVGASIVGGIKEARAREGLLRQVGGFFKGGFTREGREKGREGMGKALEKMHLVRPGYAEEEKRKRYNIDEEKKRLKDLPSNRLQEIFERKVIRKVDKQAQLAAFELLSERGDLKEDYQKKVPEMQTFGVNLKETFSKMPHWVEEIGKDIGEKIKARSAPDFVREIQTEALIKLEVVSNLDVSKMVRFGTHGTTEQRRTIVKTINNNEDELFKKIDELVNQGNMAEAERIMDVMSQIKTNPNFKV